MLEAYRQHVADRAAQNIPPAPLSPEQVAELVELLQSPPAGEEAFLVELLTERVPPGLMRPRMSKQASFLRWQRERPAAI